MPQTATSASYYYVAKPSAQLRANVVQAFNTILYLRRRCPNLNVILSSRSQAINDVFAEFDPIYPISEVFNDIFSHLERASLVRSCLEATLYSLAILRHVLLHIPRRASRSDSRDAIIRCSSSAHSRVRRVFLLHAGAQKDRILDPFLLPPRRNAFLLEPVCRPGKELHANKQE